MRRYSTTVAVILLTYGTLHAQSFADRAVLAADSTFMGRVRIAVVRQAFTVVAEPRTVTDAQARQAVINETLADMKSALADTELAGLNNEAKRDLFVALGPSRRLDDKIKRQEARKVLAGRVLNNSDQFASQFAVAVAAHPSIVVQASGGTVSTTATDADLQRVVGLIWNGYAASVR